jgi:4-diphosphocytidyl-2-C-methyl-D-erythritol kinase
VAQPRSPLAGGAAVSGEAPAKLNLFREVLGKRPDGFHELVSVFHAIDLTDRITVQLAPEEHEDSLELTGVAVEGPPGENLVLRAVAAFRAAAGRLLPVCAILHKGIPVGGGLGGGSSDAAFTLKALQLLTGRPLATAQLLGIARNLGSDVPFFLSGGTALCRGRGDLVEPLTLPAPLHFVLAQPSFGMPTAQVYRQLRLTGNVRDVIPFLHRLQSGHREGDVQCFNRLEAAALEIEPSLASLQRDLDGVTGRRWSLTGSGSVLFCVAADRREAEGMAARLSGRGGCKTYAASTFERADPPATSS